MSNGTIRSREYLEEAFSHGKIPTQCDFWDLIATFSDRDWADFVPLSGFSLMTGPLSTNMLFASCGNSDQWCTAYSLVCANSAAWFNEGQFVPLSGYATIDGPIVISGQTPAVSVASGTSCRIIPDVVGYPMTFETTIPTPVYTSGQSYTLNYTYTNTNGSYSGNIWIGGVETPILFNPGGGSGSINVTPIINGNTIIWRVIVPSRPTGSRQVCLTYDLLGPANITLSDGHISAVDFTSECGNSTEWCDAYRVSLSSLTGVSINGVTADYSNHFASFTGLTFGDTATITAINLNGIAQPPDITRTVNLNVPLSSYVPLSGNVTITNPISVDGCITADCITGLTSINLDGGDITNWSDVSAYYDLAGMDILPGDLLHIEYSPSAYDVVTPVPGLTAYPLSGHLAGIDSAITCISGVSALTFTNTTVAPTPVKTLSNYLLIKVNGSDMYLPLYT